MPSTAKGNIPLEASNHPIVRLYFSLNRGKNRRPASERLPMEEPYVYSAGTKAQIASSCAPPSSTNASTPLMAIYKLTAVTTRASRIYDIYFIFIFYCQRHGSPSRRLRRVRWTRLFGHISFDVSFEGADAYEASICIKSHCDLTLKVRINSI